jgi:hypothetical protein
MNIGDGKPIFIPKGVTALRGDVFGYTSLFGGWRRLRSAFPDGCPLTGAISEYISICVGRTYGCTNITKEVRDNEKNQHASNRPYDYVVRIGSSGIGSTE